MNIQSKFLYASFNEETGETCFIHVGTPTILDRIKYSCKPYNSKRKQYAYIPKNIEEFLLFTNQTTLLETRNFGQKTFRAYKIRPSKNSQEESSFIWIATAFGYQQLGSPDRVYDFIKKCNKIKQVKLKAQNLQTERE